MKEVSSRLKGLVSLASGYLGALSFLAFLSLVIGLSGILLPYLSRFVIDALGGRGAWGVFWKVMLAGAGVGALRWGASAFLAYKSVRVREDMAYSMRCGIVEKYLHLPLLRAEAQASGELVTVLFRDVFTLVDFWVHQVPLLVTAIIQFLGSLGVVFYWDAVLGWVVLGGTPLYLYFSLVRTGDLGDIYRKLQETHDGLTQRMMFLTGGVRLWKAAAAEEREGEAFSSLARELRDSYVRLTDRNLQISLRLRFLGYGAGLFLLFMGGLRVLNGHISVGQLVALMGFMAFLRGPLDQASHVVRDLHSVFVSLDRYKGIMDLEEEERGGKIQVHEIRPPLKVMDVRFSYGREPVLNGFSLVLNHGEMVGLKGPSGVGKTTLALIIAGLLYPQGGRVMVNGWSLEEVDIPSYRRRVGLVLQREVLFPGSIRDNIAYGKPDAADDQVEWAARMACIHSFIESLDLGYATLLGEGGGGLSQGQRQRIAIARELLKNPDVLILDEATSSLDVTTEGEVLKNIKKLGKTTLLVSHRESALGMADRVVELDNMCTFKEIQEI